MLFSEKIRKIYSFSVANCCKTWTTFSTRTFDNLVLVILKSRGFYVIIDKNSMNLFLSTSVSVSTTTVFEIRKCARIYVVSKSKNQIIFFDYTYFYQPLLISIAIIFLIALIYQLVSSLQFAVNNSKQNIENKFHVWTQNESLKKQ